MSFKTKPSSPLPQQDWSCPYAYATHFVGPENLLSSAFYQLKYCTSNRAGPHGMGVCCAIHSAARRRMMAKVNAIKRWLSHRLEFFNLWITRSVRNKLPWALRYANVSLRCRQLSNISRLHVVYRSHSAMCWFCTFLRGHRTIVFMWTLNISY